MMSDNEKSVSSIVQHHHHKFDDQFMDNLHANLKLMNLVFFCSIDNSKSLTLSMDNFSTNGWQ